RCRRVCANTMRACRTGPRRAACRRDLLRRCRIDGEDACTATVALDSGARAAALDASGVTATVIADTFVKSNDPAKNFGHSTILVVSATPKYTFLAVNVAGVGGRAVARAIVSLHVATASGSDGPSGGVIHQVTCAGWSETTLTWNTIPALGPALGPDAGPVALGATVDFDVTAVIQDDGDYCFALDTTSSDQVVYDSREVAGGEPLALVVVSDATVTPGAAPTPSATPPATTVAPTATPVQTVTTTATASGAATPTVSSVATASTTRQRTPS